MPEVGHDSGAQVAAAWTMASRGTRALQAGRGSVALTVLAATVAIIVGTAVALLGFVFPELGDDEPAEAEPVPSGVERIADLPVVPTLLVVLALVLALTASAMLLADSRPRSLVARCALLVAGPLVLLAGAELVPHLVTPCRVGEIPEICVAEAEGGFDHPRTVHPLGHALLGWLPLVVLYAWTLRRWWPDVVPRWVPGSGRRVDALVEP